jgi:hypothetical protein
MSIFIYALMRVVREIGPPHKDKRRGYSGAGFHTVPAVCANPGSTREGEGTAGQGLMLYPRCASTARSYRKRTW